MRKIKLVLVLFILMGCQSSKNISFDDMLDLTFDKVSLSIPSENNNHKKDLFSYYLPHDVGILEANKISSVLVIDNVQVFMGINVSEIMSESDDFAVANENDFEAVKEFITYNKNNKEVINNVVVEKLNDKDYLLYVKSDENFFLATLKKASIPNILEKILIIGRSIQVDKQAVILEFSNKETINYQQEVIELFTNSIPEEGFLNDIYPKDEGDSN